MWGYEVQGLQLWDLGGFRILGLGWGLGIGVWDFVC